MAVRVCKQGLERKSRRCIVYIYIHTYIYTYISMYTHACKKMNVEANRQHTHTHKCTPTMHTHTHTHTHTTHAQKPGAFSRGAAPTSAGRRCWAVSSGAGRRRSCARRRLATSGEMWLQEGRPSVVIPPFYSLAGLVDQFIWRILQRYCGWSRNPLAPL